MCTAVNTIHNRFSALSQTQVTVECGLWSVKGYFSEVTVHKLMVGGLRTVPRRRSTDR